MDSKEIIEMLNQEPEMNPDAHDGSYELMREIIKSYSAMDDYSTIDYKDLNAVYAMAIGTWKLNVEKKKEYVFSGHLPQSEKDKMRSVIDKIWNNACIRKYENRENQEKPSIGMFGTGFYSFERNADQRSSQEFIKMMVDISVLDDDNQIYDRAGQVLNSDFKGMQAAAASVMLHCLKPYTFPILNSNFGDGTVYKPLGIKLESPGKLSTYIDNCRKIKTFRDENLTIKNYRILDRFPRKYNLTTASEYFPSLDEYDPEISADQYVELIQDSSIVNRNCLDTLYFMYLMGGEATCTEIANKYGDTAQHYSAHGTTIAKAVQSATNCKLSERDEGADRYWSILFFGRHLDKTHFSWKLRDPLSEAIETLDTEGFFDYLLAEEVKMKSTISKNTILYGPPGTGKTYNTVVYAVAIIENKSVSEVYSEAMSDYDALKSRYEDYTSKGRIAFTTFHQSYGYEEFIEGIKPTLDSNDVNVEYRLEDGVFKAFCDKASKPSSNYLDKYGINSDPAIWKVSLAGSHDNPIRTECLEKGHIRIGFDKYGPNVSDRIDELGNGKLILNAFYNIMRIGDIVLSCYSASEIDAIGVVTGECEWDDSYNEYKRIRRVKWIVKNIRENILEYNKGYTMAPATVYWMGISLRDVVSILSKYKHTEDIDSIPQDNYVFIIDEINRGNISKIFGELITLIEESKRIGSSESMKVKLPYSKAAFGVPGNVFIVGTMNTADRSIAIMDTALRRRFSFEEMMPDSDVLRDMGITTITKDGQTINVPDMLDVINARIEFLYDREHTIGHAFFTPLKENPSLDELAAIFETSIIPLLQEYFYEDYGKIQLVLGDNGKTGDNKQYQFIKDEPVDVNDLFNYPAEIESNVKYTIQLDAFNKIQSYKLIDKKL